MVNDDGKQRSKSLRDHDRAVDNDACFYTSASAPNLLASIPTLTVPKSSSSLLLETKIVIVGGSVGGLAAAACLRQAGFRHVTVIERSGHQLKGAGIGLDDTAVAILKGLGIRLDPTAYESGLPSQEGAARIQRMRWTEERLSNGKILTRQPYPYFSVRYAELVDGLNAIVPSEWIVRGKKVVDIQHDDKGGAVVELQGNENDSSQFLNANMVVIANGPRSRFRSLVKNNEKKEGQATASGSQELRFAGYTAWRGLVPLEESLSRQELNVFYDDFPLFGNCIYFFHDLQQDQQEEQQQIEKSDASTNVETKRPRQSAVLYDIGGGLANWIIYERCQQPRAELGKTTNHVSPEETQRLKSTVSHAWGEAFGTLVKHCQEPFQTDVYDISFPLSSFSKTCICILGDAAHPITPHFVKGSCLALQDAHCLATCASSCTSVQDMLQRYSEIRTEECRRTIMLSRLLGRIRTGMPPLSESLLEEPTNDCYGGDAPPQCDEEFCQAVKKRAGDLATTTLPLGHESFEASWDFMEQHVPENCRGFFLQR